MNKKEMLIQEGTLAAAYEATVSTSVKMEKETIQMIVSGQMPEGDVLAKAHTAGICAMKKSSNLLPAVPPLADNAVKISLKVCSASQVDIRVVATSTTPENANRVAMMIASMTALSLYDLCKTVDQTVEVGNVTSFPEKKIA